MLITSALPVGLYARVSTDRQAEAQTVDSQVAALRERIACDAPGTTRILEFIDEGYSGTTLVRPALERLRDLAAVGGIELLYVHSPDRLARKYAHQALVLDEFSRVGVRVVLLNRQKSQQTPEDELLVQVQGVIAEYERAKIIERTRRGRRYAAQQGSVSALVHAPYGYRYVGKAQGAELPHYAVVLDEARVVRQIFDWVGRERLSSGAVARRLEAQGIPTRTGKPSWNRGTVRQILQNPTYKGEAAYGRTQSVPWRRLALRAAKHRPEHPRRSSSVEPRAAEEWITIPTPAVVEPVLFAAVQEQLVENQRRRRQRHRGTAAPARCSRGCWSVAPVGTPAPPGPPATTPAMDTRRPVPIIAVWAAMRTATAACGSVPPRHWLPRPLRQRFGRRCARCWKILVASKRTRRGGGRSCRRQPHPRLTRRPPLT